MDYEFDGFSAIAAKPSPIRWRSWAAVQVVLWLVVAFMFVLIAPKFEQIARDFGLPVTALSMVILHVSHFFHQFLPLAFLATAAVLVANVLGVRALALGSLPRGEAWLGIALLTLAPLLMVMVVCVSLLTNLMTLISRLTG